MHLFPNKSINLYKRANTPGTIGKMSLRADVIRHYKTKENIIIILLHKKYAISLDRSYKTWIANIVDCLII